MFLIHYCIASLYLFLLSLCIHLLLLKITQTHYSKKEILIQSLFIYILSLIINITGLPTLKTFHFRPNINLSPWTDIHYVPSQYKYNIIMFIPIGLLVPFLISSHFQFFKTLSFGFFLTLSIEFLQLFNFRATDIDDLIANTLGSLIGYILFKLLFSSPSKNNQNALPLKLSFLVFIIYFTTFDFLPFFP